MHYIIQTCIQDRIFRTLATSDTLPRIGDTFEPDDVAEFTVRKVLFRSAHRPANEIQSYVCTVFIELCVDELSETVISHFCNNEEWKEGENT